jgi:hypothetical protein
MAKIYELRNKPVIDDDGDYQNASIPKSGVDTVVASKRLKTGVRAYLVKIGNAVSAGAETYIKWNLRVNGAPLDQRFADFMNMITDPANPEAQLAKEYEVPQGALVELYAVNSDTTADYSVTGSIQIYYTDL